MPKTLPPEIISHIMSFIRPTHPLALLIQDANKKKYDSSLPLYINVLNIDMRPRSYRIRTKYVLKPFYDKYETVMEDWTFKTIEWKIRAYEKRVMPKTLHKQYLTEYQHWLSKEKQYLKFSSAVRELSRIRTRYLFP